VVIGAEEMDDRVQLEVARCSRGCEARAVTWSADGEHRAARDAHEWRRPVRARCSVQGNTKGTSGLELGMSNDELQDRQWRPAEKELKLRRVMSKTVLRRAGECRRAAILCTGRSRGATMRWWPAVNLFAQASRERGRTTML
jgi:hypothetical protein